MPLTLQLVHGTTLPDGGPVSFQLSGKNAIDIGRAAHVDWTLPDPTRLISNKHCEIRYKDGGYWLRDVSTNGTFVNGADHRMQAPHRLRNGDRFIVGHYLVAVTLAGAEGVAQCNPRHSNYPPAEGMIRMCGRTKKMLRRLWTPSSSCPARKNALVDWWADIPSGHGCGFTRTACKGFRVIVCTRRHWLGEPDTTPTRTAASRRGAKFD